MNGWRIISCCDVVVVMMWCVLSVCCLSRPAAAVSVGATLLAVRGARRDPRDPRSVSVKGTNTMTKDDLSHDQLIITDHS